MLVAILLLLSSFAQDAPAPQSEAASVERNVYRFRVESRRGPVTFRVEMDVDGVHRVIEDAVTPFEFECEAANTMVGGIDTLDPDQEVTLKVYLTSGRKRRIGRARGNPINFWWNSRDGGQRVSIAYVQQ